MSHVLYHVLKDMNRLILLILVFSFCFYSSINAQNHLSSDLVVFENLLEGKWKGDGKWNNGMVFKQMIKYSPGLGGKIITVYTQGNISKTGFRWGDRSYGVRQWDDSTKSIRFWEFDVFGGRTEGIVLSRNQDIFYTYNYDSGEGIIELSEVWLFVGKDEYGFRIGVYEGNEWKKVFLDGKFTRVR